MLGPRSERWYIRSSPIVYLRGQGEACPELWELILQASEARDPVNQKSQVVSASVSHGQEISSQPRQTSSFSASRIPVWGCLEPTLASEIRTQTRKASGCSPAPRRLGSPVGDRGRGGERFPLRSPLRLVWASGKVPDGHRPSRRSVPGTGPARPLRTPLAPGNSASFPE